MTCEVKKEVICDNCTQEQAEGNPFDHVVSEREISQSDYSVDSVEENV